MDEPLFNELLESVKQADQIMTDHAELRRLAKAATPGARYQGTDERVIVAGNGTIICTVSGAISGPSVMADAEFLCATDPNTILGLIADLEEARNGMEYQPIMRLKNELDRLKAENEALLLGMRAILNAYDYADQYNKEGVAVEVMEDLRTLFKGATQ
ncbi:TPA: hypothetical protein L4Q98_004707 [Pseudomonas aeruginosa]|uniref:hypothetical protein n=2 Tax=Pseudomonas aeruginosa TaxID=287 RepID=UPI0015F711AF|nr:hypothetical protein [Pseudomonas aeruginosa]MBA5391800.1 hypothetical protein [Pseudomonas aeruginosa]HBO3026689.1 hypothetical protein [Pseudomonas aeruginosa]